MISGGSSSHHQPRRPVMDRASVLSEFIDVLRASRLLGDAVLDAVGSELTPQQAAEQLVGGGALTEWQAEMLLAGRTRFFLGKYKLLDLLGRGGMGAVFLAEQHPLGRKVAVKVMAEKLVHDAASVARFQREIQAAAAVDHRHVITAFDADHVGEAHFLVMEYVDGRDLGGLTRRGRALPIGLACEIVRQAALGLEHAHRRGMVHRDVKPGNLLLAFTDEGRPLVKVLDLGLSRFAHASEDGSLTQSGQIMGTPDYIAPEQARDTKSADAKSDVYSLGCTLFALLAGRVPFPGGERRRADHTAVHRRGAARRLARRPAAGRTRRPHRPHAPPRSGAKAAVGRRTRSRARTVLRVDRRRPVCRRSRLERRARFGSRHADRTGGARGDRTAADVLADVATEFRAS